MSESDPPPPDPHSFRCATVPVAPVVSVTAANHEAEGETLVDIPKIQPVPKPELFVATNDFPHIIFEKGQYYIIQILDDSSMVACTEKKKVYYLDLTGIRQRNTHAYLKLSVGKEIELIKSGPYKTQEVGEFSMRGFSLPSALHQALLVQTIGRNSIINSSIPASYFYGNVGALPEPFMVSRIFTDSVHRYNSYYNSIKLYSLTRPATLSQLKNFTLTPVYKTDINAKPDQQRIKNLIFDFEQLVKSETYNAIIHYQTKKFLQLTPEQKEDLQRILNHSEVAVSNGFQTRYRFTQRIGSPYAPF